MKLSTPSFRGMAPRVTPRALPPNAAQRAINCRLLTGDLQAWRRPLLTKQLAVNSSGPVETIALIDDAWMSWQQRVEVARGIIPGDTTFRTFITGLDVPRFTDYELATTGPEPYPVTTRILGVPAPVVAPELAVGQGPSPDINVTDSGDQFSSWVTSGSVALGSTVSEVAADAANGNPAPSYRHTFANNSGAPAFQYRDFGVEVNRSVTFSSQFAPTSNGAALQAEFRFLNSAAGSGCHVGVGYPQGPSNGLFLTIGVASNWSTVPSYLEQIAIAPLDGSGATYYTMEITGERQANGTVAVVARLLEGATVLATADLTSAFDLGGYCGWGGITDFTPAMVTRYDNLSVVGSGAFDPADNVGTSYVFTYVNDLGQESAPSLPSATILRPDGASVTVTTPTVLPTGFSDDYGIATKRIYRSTTASGTVFRLVAEIDLAVADYVDSLEDQELGEVLASSDWDMPPPNLRFITALPNGIMVGAAGNQLCFSVKNYPHAWPIRWRLPTDTDITGLGNVDTSVVIGTKSFVYTASGNDPSSYSMSKPGAPQACSSNRGFAYLLNIGCVFPSPEGYMLVNGPTQVSNLTDSIFTQDQWKGLDPSSIIAAAHNDILFFFWDNGTDAGGYALDMKETGFGLIELGFHASAIYVDAEQDALFMVLDAYEEPESELLPGGTGASLAGVDGRTIFEFDAAEELMRYSWTGKLWMLPHPMALQWMRLRAREFVELAVEVNVANDEGTEWTLREKLVSSNKPFRLSLDDAYSVLQYTLIGTSRMRTGEIADDITELE